MCHLHCSAEAHAGQQQPILQQAGMHLTAATMCHEDSSAGLQQDWSWVSSASSHGCCTGTVQDTTLARSLQHQLKLHQPAVGPVQTRDATTDDAAAVTADMQILRTPRDDLQQQQHADQLSQPHQQPIDQSSPCVQRMLQHQCIKGLQQQHCELPQAAQRPAELSGVQPTILLQHQHQHEQVAAGQQLLHNEPATVHQQGQQQVVQQELLVQQLKLLQVQMQQLAVHNQHLQEYLAEALLDKSQLQVEHQQLRQQYEQLQQQQQGQVIRQQQGQHGKLTGHQQPLEQQWQRQQQCTARANAAGTRCCYDRVPLQQQELKTSEGPHSAAAKMREDSDDRQRSLHQHKHTNKSSPSSSGGTQTATSMGFKKVPAAAAASSAAASAQQQLSSYHLPDLVVELQQQHDCVMSKLKLLQQEQYQLMERKIECDRCLSMLQRHFDAQQQHVQLMKSAPPQTGTAAQHVAVAAAAGGCCTWLQMQGTPVHNDTGIKVSAGSGSGKLASNRPNQHGTQLLPSSTTSTTVADAEAAAASAAVAAATTSSGSLKEHRRFRPRPPSAVAAAAVAAVSAPAVLVRCADSGGSCCNCSGRSGSRCSSRIRAAVGTSTSGNQQCKTADNVAPSSLSNALPPDCGMHILMGSCAESALLHTLKMQQQSNKIDMVDASIQTSPLSNSTSRASQVPSLRTDVESAKVAAGQVAESGTLVGLTIDAAGVQQSTLPAAAGNSSCCTTIVRSVGARATALNQDAEKGCHLAVGLCDNSCHMIAAGAHSPCSAMHSQGKSRLPDCTSSNRPTSRSSSRKTRQTAAWLSRHQQQHTALQQIGAEQQQHMEPEQQQVQGTDGVSVPKEQQQQHVDEVADPVSGQQHTPVVRTLLPTFDADDRAVPPTVESLKQLQQQLEQQQQALDASHAECSQLTWSTSFRSSQCGSDGTSTYFYSVHTAATTEMGLSNRHSAVTVWEGLAQESVLPVELFSEVHTRRARRTSTVLSADDGRLLLAALAGVRDTVELKSVVAAAAAGCIRVHTAARVPRPNVIGTELMPPL